VCGPPLFGSARCAPGISRRAAPPSEPAECSLRIHLCPRSGTEGMGSIAQTGSAPHAGSIYVGEGHERTSTTGCEALRLSRARCNGRAHRGRGRFRSREASALDTRRKLGETFPRAPSACSARRAGRQRLNRARDYEDRAEGQPEDRGWPPRHRPQPDAPARDPYPRSERRSERVSEHGSAQ